MEDKILKISKPSHSMALFSLIVRILLFLCLLVWFRFEKDAILIFGILFFIDATPALFLYIKYWIKNYGEEFLFIFINPRINPWVNKKNISSEPF